MMDARTWVTRYFLLPAVKQLGGRNFLAANRELGRLRSSQYLPRAVLEARTEENLTRMMARCLQEVPFYREWAQENDLAEKEMAGLSGLRQFPVLSKDLLNSRFQDFIADGIDPRNQDVRTTGGTSGNSTKFIREKKKEFLVDANNWRFWEYAGYEKGMPMALFWGNLAEVLNAHKAKARLKYYLHNMMLFNCFQYGEADILGFLEVLRRKRPAILRGYASALFFVARTGTEAGLSLGYHPKSIIVTSDKIVQPEKDVIRDFFGCEIFEEYGCREFSIMAHECEAHNGMHLAEESMVFEVLNTETGEVSGEGTGELLVSGLNNDIMPLLRYRMGDIVTISSDPCPCGRTLRLVKDVHGRSKEYLETAQGHRAMAAIFTAYLSGIKGIRGSQFEQNRPGEALFKVVVREGADPKAVLSEIRNALDKILSGMEGDLMIEVKGVSNLPPPSSGKRVMIKKGPSPFEEGPGNGHH